MTEKMKKNKPLVTVIVPVYKVEKHIHRCLDSIVQQTYGNLEIILIDDGSPDESGRICDEYAAKDPRITVIHQQNGGISDARNKGLDKARGEYIGFVDSDDWIHLEMYQKLVEIGLEHHADIAIGGHNYVTKSRIFPPYQMHGIQIYHTREAMIELLRDETFSNFMWNKIYKRDLFEGIRFPKGQVMEDMAVAYRLFLKAEKVVLHDRPLYYYVVDNPESISANHTLDFLYDHIHFCAVRLEHLKADYPEIISRQVFLIVKLARMFYAKYDRKRDVEYQKKNMSIRSVLKSYRKEILFHKDIEKGPKLKILLASVDDRAMNGYIRMRHRLFGGK